jgi:hypothetical protein
VVCHSGKEQASPTFKKTFGYHLMLAFYDNTADHQVALPVPGYGPGHAAAGLWGSRTRGWVADQR